MMKKKILICSIIVVVFLMSSNTNAGLTNVKSDDDAFEIPIGIYQNGVVEKSDIVSMSPQKKAEFDTLITTIEQKMNNIKTLKEAQDIYKWSLNQLENFDIYIMGELPFNIFCLVFSTHSSTNVIDPIGNPFVALGVFLKIQGASRVGNALIQFGMFKPCKFLNLIGFSTGTSTYEMNTFGFLGIQHITMHPQSAFIMPGFTGIIIFNPDNPLLFGHAWFVAWMF